MATLEEVRNNIIDDLDGRTDLNTRIDLEINRAIKHYSKESLWFQEKILDFYTSVGKANYDVFDTGFTLRDVFLVELYDENGTPAQKYRLFDCTLSVEQWLNWPVSINGIPYNFTYFAEQIMLDRPCLSDLYHIFVYGTAEYVDLVNDTDENDFTINASELIEARALKIIWKRVLKSNPQMVVDYQTLEDEALLALKEKSIKLTTKGSIQPSQF